MSYLSGMRLTFAGRFLADPSTINNDPGHYDNASFDRAVHWQPGGDGGWWNPGGANRFSFTDVKVVGAVLADGSVAAADAVLGMRFESRGRRAGKLVDLDPDQQLVSMIFGLRLQLFDAADHVLLEGRFEPAPFTDLWAKGGDGGDQALSVAWQSVLHVDQWGDLTSSPVLQALRAAAAGNLLSIKFNLDGYSMAPANPGFTTGRVVGSIGVADAAAPRHHVVGRHLAGPAVNNLVAVVDETRGKIRVDLGNALPTATLGGASADLGRLMLGWVAADGTATAIDEIEYRAPDWFETTAGIVEVPRARALTAAERQAVAASPLCLLTPDAAEPLVALEQEDVVRADQFVARVNPGEPARFRFIATRRGKPLADTPLLFRVMVPNNPDAQTHFPRHGLVPPANVTTGAGGDVVVDLASAAPGEPRFFYNTGAAGAIRRAHVDGQVYKVLYRLPGVPPRNPDDVLSVLVWSDFTADAPPTWHGSMRALFEQYGNLYPWMAINRGLDLASYEQVAAAAARIVELMQLEVTASAYMPVTRDLSRARSEAMITWLENPGADGLPLLGTAPPSPPGGFVAPQAPLPTAIGAAPGGSGLSDAHQALRELVAANDDFTTTSTSPG